MTDFRIERGLSSVLFTAPGVVNKQLVIKEGCWYLCTDTAELFLGVADAAGTLSLKQINGEGFTSVDNKILAAIDELKKELKSLDDSELFKKISTEAELPTDFEAEDFNPNITYYIQISEGRVSTYIFDRTSQSYLCTNNIDDLVVRAMVSDAIELTLNDSLDRILPEAIKRTIETIILHGGTATTNI